MKHLNRALNILLGACIGCFVGHCLYCWWDYNTHPALYAMHSAPWYTSMLLSGAVTAAVLLIVMLVKLFIRKKQP